MELREAKPVITADDVKRLEGFFPSLSPLTVAVYYALVRWRQFK